MIYRVLFHLRLINKHGGSMERRHFIDGSRKFDPAIGVKRW